MTPTLLLIDLQPRFWNSINADILNSAARLIRKTIKNKGHIIVVEYAGSSYQGKDQTHVGHSDTYSVLLNAIGTYNKSYIVHKNLNDGGREVFEVIKEYNIYKDRFIVGGVNLTACVADTITGLQVLLPKSKFVICEDATGDSTGYINPKETFIERTNNCNVKIRQLKTKVSK